MKQVVVSALFAFTTATFAAPPPVGPHGEPARKLAIYAPRPNIPAEARARHLTGAGVCVVYVRPDGTVERAKMLQSTGQPLLDKASIEAFSLALCPRLSNKSKYSDQMHPHETVEDLTIR